MKQKEIWLTELSPTVGTEIRGKRPVVIISGDLFNLHAQQVIACPITSKIKHFSGCLIIEKNDSNGLQMDSEVLVFQVRSLDKFRLLHRIGEISEDDLETIKKGLLKYLTY